MRPEVRNLNNIAHRPDKSTICMDRVVWTNYTGSNLICIGEPKTMLESQKLTIELSKAREQRDTLTAAINKSVSAGDDAKPDDLAALDTANETIKGLEIRYRAAVTQEDEETRAANDNGGDAEERERIELRSRASLGKFLLASLTNKAVDGAEAELRAAAGITDGIPLELFDIPQPEKREDRADAASVAPSTVGINYRPALPSIFARALLPRIGVDMPMVQSGSAGYAVLTTDLSAGAQDKGGAAMSTAAAFTTATRTPKRISARLSIQAEDLAAVGLPGFEAQLRQNLSLALSSKLDEQGLSGDGSAPNLQGIVSGITDVAAPGAQTDYKGFVNAMAGGIDGGPWAESLSDVILVVNAEVMRFSESVFQVTGAGGFTTAISAAQYLRSNARGYMASSRMPAVTGNKKVGQCLRVRLGTQGLDGVNAPQVASMPVWNMISIDDVYSDSAKATRHFTLHILVGDPVVLYSAAYEKVAVQLVA